MFLCILILLLIIQDECFAKTITPLQDRTQVTEGKSVNLACTYDGSVQSLLWYRQYRGSGLEFLLLVVESSTKSVVYADPPIPRLDGEMSMKDKRVDLIISSAEVTDSALYYCALVPTVTENTTPLMLLN
uniref:T-cell receptor alpha/delta variable 10.0.5 n=1 Tax=Sinocyclocheilus anshuiensis TaxID=1608454 RepID=A0A671QAF9_9TELE